MLPSICDYTVMNQLVSYKSEMQKVCGTAYPLQWVVNVVKTNKWLNVIIQISKQILYILYCVEIYFQKSRPEEYNGSLRIIFRQSISALTSNEKSIRAK